MVARARLSCVSIDQSLPRPAPAAVTAMTLSSKLPSIIKNAASKRCLAIVLAPAQLRRGALPLFGEFIW
ncbi:hypothetical protein ATE48_07305 [Candidatus Viadribacter manganicus]|uniref:Uncharacterized protein n=1 Tax=Candidatus Viadribacter manganicus TaxID=1759059 RepID=A0A1B1AGQ7_9PROT|nr:hypothetical protein ATE48_07305 [Candidatus Viadribacter manganicus]